MSGPGGGAIGRLDGPAAVSAGAGAGKTAALVEAVLGLLSGEAGAEPCDPGSLAAITFTERAAAELEERLRRAVAERAATAEGEAARAWRERLQGLERMSVGTIHAFAGALLREHAAEAELDPDFQVLDEESAEALRRDAAQAAVLAAADSGDAAMRQLLAGHGVGGRRGGLAERVSDLVRQRAAQGLRGPVEPAEEEGAAESARAGLLAAAEALCSRREQVRTASGRGALAALQAALDGLSSADRSGPLGLDTARRLAAMADAVKGWRPGAEEGDGLAAARATLSRAAAAVVPAAAGTLGLPQSRALGALVAAAEEGFARRKAESSALDFDDLLLRARDLLRADGGVRAAVRCRMRALLVDEYQDVNRVQHDLVDLLTAKARGEPPGPLLLAVGDLKQSIYRFRGADVTVFAELLSRLSSDPGGRVLHLVANHRSTPAVLAVVNAVCARAAAPGAGPLRPYEVPFGEADQLVAVRRGGMAPACEILADGEGGPAAERRAREGRAVAERIQAIVSGAAGVTVADPETGQTRPPRRCEVAVLFRRLTQVGAYERALRAAGIPYRLARGGGFYQAPEVRDLGELAASLADPGDAIAWAALLRSPACGVSEGTLLLVARLGLGTLGRRQPQEVVDAVRAGWPEGLRPPGHRAELGRLHRFLCAWRALWPLRDRLALSDLLARAVEELDLEAAHLAAPDGERRLQNLRKALGLARRAGDAGTARAFAARLRGLAHRPPREPEAELEAADAVAVLSVHQAKGLEWPVVFVPDLGARPRGDLGPALWDAQGRLCAGFFDLAAEVFAVTPALRAAQEEERRAAAAESRRLLYVALTRARDYLVLSGQGSAGDGSWAGPVGAALSGRRDLAVGVPAAEAATFAVAAPVAPGPAAAAASPEAVAPPPLAAAPPLAAVRLPVTEFAEYARCPRRRFLSLRLCLPERPPVAGGAPARDDPARATARGALAHAMLAEADLAAPPPKRRAQLAAAAARLGYRAASPAVRRILGEVCRFLEAPPGRRLAALARAGALQREVPFLLRIEGSGGLPACYLSGAIDALAQGRGEVEVVDFKYAVGRPEGRVRYRLQLLTYALAAARAFPGLRVRASLQFLRGDLAAVDMTPSAVELERFAALAPRLALGAHRGEGEQLTPAEMGRTEEACRAEGCGHLARCYPAAAVAASAFSEPARVAAAPGGDAGAPRPMRRRVL